MPWGETKRLEGRAVKRITQGLFVFVAGGFLLWAGVALFQSGDGLPKKPTATKPKSQRTRPSGRSYFVNVTLGKMFQRITESRYEALDHYYDNFRNLVITKAQKKNHSLTVKEVRQESATLRWVRTVVDGDGNRWKLDETESSLDVNVSATLEGTVIYDGIRWPPRVIFEVGEGEFLELFEE